MRSRTRLKHKARREERFPSSFPISVICWRSEFLFISLGGLIAFRPSLWFLLFPQLCISLLLVGVRLICNRGQWWSRSLVKNWFITLPEFPERNRNLDESPRSIPQERESEETDFSPGCHATDWRPRALCRGRASVRPSPTARSHRLEGHCLVLLSDASRFLSWTRSLTLAMRN